MSEQERPIESLKHEYEDVTQNIRHYSNLRFVIFSVFFAVMGGIVVLAFSDSGVTQNTPEYAKVGGLLITLSFWAYEERAGQIFSHFRKVGIDLENKLAYRQISSMPSAKFPILEAKYTTRLFFALWTIFWIAVIVKLL